MGHGSARITHAVRAAIQRSKAPLKELQDHRPPRASAQAATRRDLPGHRHGPTNTSRVSRSLNCSPHEAPLVLVVIDPRASCFMFSPALILAARQNILRNVPTSVVPCLWLISRSWLRWRLPRPALLILLSIVLHRNILLLGPNGNLAAATENYHGLSHKPVMIAAA